MIRKFSQFLDFLSNFLAHRKGLLPLIGIGFITINYIIQFYGENWLVSSNLFLHVGCILAIFGMMLAWAL